jgi:hypothetical protein
MALATMSDVRSFRRLRWLTRSLYVFTLSASSVFSTFTSFAAAELHDMVSENDIDDESESSASPGAQTLPSVRRGKVSENDDDEPHSRAGTFAGASASE